MKLSTHLTRAWRAFSGGLALFGACGYLLAAAALPLLLLYPVAAFAQDVAAAPDPKGALMGLFIQHIAPVLFSGVALALTYAFAQLGKKFGASAAESKRDAALTRLFLFAQSVVADLEATLKPKLLEATSDGTLTEVEIATLRAAALDRLKQLAGEKGLAEVQALLGIASPQMDAFLSGLIERAVGLLPSKPKTALAEPSPVVSTGAMTELAAVPR